jgi:hypothetical protein
VCYEGWCPHRQRQGVCLPQGIGRVRVVNTSNIDFRPLFSKTFSYFHFTSNLFFAPYLGSLKDASRKTETKHQIHIVFRPLFPSHRFILVHISSQHPEFRKRLSSPVPCGSFFRPYFCIGEWERVIAGWVEMCQIEHPRIAPEWRWGRGNCAYHGCIIVFRMEDIYLRLARDCES